MSLTIRQAAETLYIVSLLAVAGYCLWSFAFVMP